jgi:hypothetical protein
MAKGQAVAIQNPLQADDSHDGKAEDDGGYGVFFRTIPP